jgi:hypothetical protein
MSNECERCLQWIKDDLAGELDVDHRRRMEAHLEDCPACAHEKVALEHTIGLLGEFQEEPLPRHFFVYEDSGSARKMAQLLRNVTLGWKVAFAGTAVMLLIGFVFVLGQTTLQWDQGRLTVAFGAVREQPDSRADISQKLMGVVRQVVQDENRKWSDEVRREVAASLARATDEDRRAMQNLVVELEMRLEQKLDARDDGTRELLQTTLKQWSRALAVQRQEDLSQIQQALMQFAANDQLQAGQARVIMAALSQMVEVRNSRGGSR